jgi:hypothetical protein
MEIPSRLVAIRERMEGACRRAGRPSSAVTLIAVSKTRTVEEVVSAVEAGITDLGENRVQEAEAKAPSVAAKVGSTASPPRWHLVGHLQKNKVKKAVALFDRIHSLDSVELGERVDRAAEETGKVQPVLVQVDLALEPTKFGLPEKELLPTLEHLASLPRLSVDGLMVLPPYIEDPEGVRPFFRRLSELSAEARGHGLAGCELSMGMSHDFEVAIEEGATFIRVGTALFGSRDRQGEARGVESAENRAASERRASEH